MDTRWGRIRRAALAAMIAMLVSFLRAPAFAADKEVIPSVAAPEMKPAAINGSSKMVGAETCVSCHAEKSAAFAKTFHGRKVLSNPKLGNMRDANATPRARLAACSNVTGAPLVRSGDGANRVGRWPLRERLRDPGGRHLPGCRPTLRRADSYDARHRALPLAEGDLGRPP